MNNGLAHPLTAEELAETPHAIELNGEFYDPDHLYYCACCRAAFDFPGDLSTTSDGIQMCEECADVHEIWLDNGRNPPNHWRE